MSPNAVALVIDSHLHLVADGMGRRVWSVYTWYALFVLEAIKAGDL